MPGLIDVFPTPEALVALEPEELAGVLLELIPEAAPNGAFVWQHLVNPAFEQHRSGSWPRWQMRGVTLAVAASLEWLKSQGLLIRDPEQPADWLIFTRRGEKLKTRVDLEAYRKGSALPIQLLQPTLAEKVHHLFVRGDHDTAVFQAFKEVEVAVRRACGYPDDLVGRALMQRAFALEDGPLRNPELVRAEREAEFYLFAGAMGHCKNPASHRDVELEREEAARLIVFASHLLAIVETRAALES